MAPVITPDSGPSNASVCFLVNEAWYQDCGHNPKGRGILWPGSRGLHLPGMPRLGAIRQDGESWLYQDRKSCRADPNKRHDRQGTAQRRKTARPQDAPTRLLARPTSSGAPLIGCNKVESFPRNRDELFRP